MHNIVVPVEKWLSGIFGSVPPSYPYGGQRRKAVEPGRGKENCL